MSIGKNNKSALNEKEGVEKPSSLNQTVAQNVKAKRTQQKKNKQLISNLIKGDKTALSQAITIVESTASKHQEIAKEIIAACLPHANKSFRVGITGVPGVGKSTFIESIGKLLLTKTHKIAVLAVDPSSSISKGSILGDKTRMEALVKEENVFIRPSASGSSLGGVARKTRETIILCEAAGFDVVLIETVGVGQSETAVHSMTDFFLLLKLAGAGDELQGIKRGIMEMADAIVINKADGENIKAAKLAKTEFNRALHLYPPKESGWVPKTLTCSAIKNEGILEVFELINQHKITSERNGFFQKKRTQQNNFWLLQAIEEQLQRDFFENPKIKEALKGELQKIAANKTTPFEAAEYILNLKKSL